MAQYQSDWKAETLSKTDYYNKFKSPKQPDEDFLTSSLHFFNNLMSQAHKNTAMCSE